MKNIKLNYIDTVVLAAAVICVFLSIEPFFHSQVISQVAHLSGVLLLFLIFFVTYRGKKTENALDEAEKAVIDQNKLYERVLDNIPGILFIKDARDNFRYTFFNKEAGKFFGYDPAEMTGKFDKDLFNEAQASFFHSIDKAVMVGGNIIDVPCEIVKAYDGERMVHTRKVPVFDRDGQGAFLVGLSEDITERKRNEMELTEYRQRLEIMVEERTKKLNDAMMKAEEANRLKSEFLATMSHEIRSPMSGVLGMAELLLDTPLTIEQRGLSKTILNSGEVLMNIIEDILDFSKIEANKIELDLVPVNMLELVDDVCMLYSSRARDKALEIVVQYAPGCEQFFHADPLRIRQILGNLVNNAIKFTQKGYISIKVSHDFKNAPSGNHANLVFCVEDTGIGIDEKDQKRIFEKFSQANSSTTRDYGGTGLGLAICRKLVELMAGTISLESVPGKGSSFSFTLPLLINREENMIHPNPPILKDLRILIVDDLPVLRATLCEQLSMAGMVCDTASSGHEALQKILSAKIDEKQYNIIILDYLMPGMNGEMLARAIHGDEDYKDICLIMLTAAGNPSLAGKTSNEGFSAFISKPVRTTTLLDNLAIIWNKYQGGQKNSLIRFETPQAMRNRNAEHLKLEGTRILLVEDSRINQAFVQEVLSQMACDVVTVSNGREAVDSVIQESFDLVLMDCQMPVMDGFEASRLICAMKDQGLVNKDLPILALTANAMKGDRQRCIDAGMNDYITKPVRKKELKEKIYFWVKKEKIILSGDNEEIDPFAAVGGDDEEILNISLFEEARSLLKDKFDFLLGCYLEDSESYIREIQDAAANKNLEGVIRPAHTIKSTSKRMGALCLSKIARDIEIAARDAANANGDASFTPPILKDIQQIAEVFEETKKSFHSAQRA